MCCHDVVFQPEARPVRAWIVGSMADRQRTDAGLPIAADVEERRALRGGQPLVAVARVIRGTDLVQLDRDHPRSVCPVHQGVHAAPIELLDEFGDRQDDARGARDVAEEREPRSRRDPREDRGDDGIGIEDGECDVGDHDPCIVPLGRVVQRVQRGVVLEARREEFVPGLEADGAQHRADPGSRIRHEREIVGVRTQEGRERAARVPSISAGSCRPRKSMGSASIASRQACWAARHGARARPA